MYDDKLFTLVSAGCIFFAIMGFLIILFGSKENERLRTIGIAYFAGGMGGTAMFFLIKNPDILESAQEHIAITLIGMVIATITFIRFLKR